MNPEIEKQRLQEAEREASRARKRLQRQREKQAKTLYERAKNREQFWADNRAALKPEEVKELERRQAEFLPLIRSVQDVIDGLNLPGAKIGEPDGLPYPDVLFEEVEDYLRQTGNCRGIHHVDEEEFASIHRPDEQKIRECFYQVDFEWYTYGIFTRFPHYTLRHFVSAVARYIKEHPGDPDFDPEIAQKILIEDRGNAPAPSPVTHNNMLATADNGEAYVADVENQYRATERQNSKELLRARRDMAKEPINRPY